MIAALRTIGHIPAHVALTAALLLRDAVASLGAALLLLAAGLLGLGPMLLRPTVFDRRRVVDALARGALLPLPLAGATAAILGASIGLAMSYGYAFAYLERFVIPIVRLALLRQTAPILVALLVMVEAALALSVRLATMDEDGEANTLRSLGIAPLGWVLPASLLEFIVFGAVQFLCVAAIGQLAAALVLQADFNIAAARSLATLGSGSARADFWSGAARAELAVMLAWLAAVTAGIISRPGPGRRERAVRATALASVVGALLVVATANLIGA